MLQVSNMLVVHCQTFDAAAAVGFGQGFQEEHAVQISFREFTTSEILADELTRMLMRADKVSPNELATLLETVAGRISARKASFHDRLAGDPTAGVRTGLVAASRQSTASQATTSISICRSSGRRQHSCHL
jgi:hypothetical protein